MPGMVRPAVVGWEQVEAERESSRHFAELLACTNARLHLTPTTGSFDRYLALNMTKY